MQEIHAAHRQCFGVAVFMGDEVFERAGVEERSDGDEAVAFVEVAPGQEFLVDAADVRFGYLMFLHDAAQLVVLLAVGIDFGDELWILQVVAVGLDQTIGFSGAAQRVAHFGCEQQADDDKQDKNNCGHR